MKKHLWLKILAGILGSIAAFMLVINILPPEKNPESNPFLVEKGGLPMIAAHRGGGAVNPENTLLAFREAVYTYGVDILESDLYMTRDGHLVFSHNSYVDLTCDANGDMSLADVKKRCQVSSYRHYIASMTLEELQQYNFGYYFQNAHGERPYREVEDPAAMGLQIATLEQVLGEFSETHPDLLFIVEIKDKGNRGMQVCKALYEVLQKYPQYLNRVVVGTYHDEVEEELRTHYPELLRGASTGPAAKFVVTQYLGVNLFDTGDFACLQIPVDYDVGFELNLATRSLIRRAHRRNVAVQYWTVNDPDQMRMLIELGCDAIMTDDPALLRQILEEYR